MSLSNRETDTYTKEPTPKGQIMVPATSNKTVQERNSYPGGQAFDISSEMLGSAGEILKFHHMKQHNMAGPALLGGQRGSAPVLVHISSTVKFPGFSWFSSTVTHF